MPLQKTYIRNGKRQIIGSVTTGFAAQTSIVRDSMGGVIGRTSGVFNTTRDARGGLVSTNTADPGLLIKNKG